MVKQWIIDYGAIIVFVMLVVAWIGFISYAVWGKIQRQRQLDATERARVERVRLDYEWYDSLQSEDVLLSHNGYRYKVTADGGHKYINGDYPLYPHYRARFKLQERSGPW